MELLADIDMLLRINKRIIGGTCYSINRYAKGNDKYMEE